jgi:hypothetical protein
MMPGGIMSDDGVPGWAIRIEGKIDMIQATNERTASDLGTLKTQQHSLSNRVGALEAVNHFSEGKKAGVEEAVRVVSGTMKAIYAVAGVLITLVAAVIARSYGL